MLEIYKNKKVLVFGNTGFVGTNLTLFLLKLGANVIGYSNKKFEYFEKLNLESRIIQYYDKIEYYNYLRYIINKHNPDIIINLAAQALVKKSYKYPRETYETNILGSLYILEAIRQENKPIVFLNVTSDKCYKNKEQNEAYNESDELNGNDIYSNSKSCAELITETYRNCFFNINDYNKHNTLIATLRSGNIIGMGDFGEYRLIPDIMKSSVNKEKVLIRNPNATRPWIFILDTIVGYLMVGEKLLQKEKQYSGAWNFSLNYSDAISVLELLNKIKKHINIEYEIDKNNHDKESQLLKLDSTKAKELLKWQPKYNIDKIIKITSKWYYEYYTNNKIITYQIIDEYLN